MSEQEQAAAYLRVRKEYQSLTTELTAIGSALKHMGNTLLANGKVLTITPDQWNIDVASLCTDLRKTADMAERYRNMQVEIADKRAELEQFGEIFPPLK